MRLLSRLTRYWRLVNGLTPVRLLRKAALLFALGPSYYYMTRTVRQDRRLRTARTVDIVVRKDAVERRIEADWIKEVARILDPAPPRLPVGISPETRSPEARR